MKISIIIVNYNTYKLTSQCIQSIYNKERSTDFEIILVDNASIECHPRKFKQYFPDIILVKSEKNLGFSGGNNLGIKKATGEIILLLNSDTKLINNAVTLATTELEKDNTIGVLSGQLQYANGEHQPVAGRFPSIRRELRELFRLNTFLDQESRGSYYLGTEWDYTKPAEVDWVWGTFFMFRKKDLHFFPEGKLHDTFFMYGEDLQWCYHFNKVIGKKVVYDPTPKIIHYIGGSDGEEKNVLDRYFEKMLPHEHQWLCMEKGKFYCKLYYLVKALLYLTLRKQSELYKAKVFLNLAITGKI